MAEFIEVLSDKAIKDVDLLISKINEGTKSINKFNAEAKQFNVPSKAVETINKVNKSTNDLNRTRQKANKTAKQIERQERKRQRQRVQELQLQKKRERAFDKYERQLAREEKRLQRSQGLYNRVQQRVNKLTLEYNNLAARKELNGKLTRQEAKDLDYLEGQLNKYQGVLKRVDANIGKYQRNVGNYASGWNGLGNSINQLTREAPAFANSLQTGFMALSNNIPILVDEINRLKVANKQLQAQGKPTTSVLKQIGKSLLSWQTAISVGVTLLTLYGAELVDWASSFFSASDAVSKANKAMDDFNEALGESQGSIKTEIVSLRSLISVAGDETVERQKRNDAVQILQDKYPDYLKNLTTENAKSKEIANSVDQITKALENKAKMQAAEQLVTKKAQKFFEEQLKAEEEYQERRSLIAEGVRNSLGLDLDNLDNFSKSQLKSIYDQFGRRLDEIDRQRQDAIDAAEDDFSNYSTFIQDLIANTPDLFDLFGGGSDSGSGGGDTNKVLEGTIAFYEKLISSLKTQQNETATTAKEWQNYQTQIEKAEAALLKLRRAFMGMEDQTALDVPLQSQDPIESQLTTKGFDDFINGTDRAEANVQKLIDALDKLAAKELLFDELAGLGDMLNIDVNKIRDNFDKYEDEATATALAATEIFGGIGQTLFGAEQQRLQEQIALNSEYYNNLIQQAQGNEQQQELLRREQARKERQLRREQAENEKKSALFEIALNTAAAIIKTFATLGFPAGVAPAAAVGAIGAAKAALVASQPVPQYKTGREGGKDEWAILGDGYKHEPILDKDGNLKGMSPKKPTLMHLDKGDTVKSDIGKLPEDILQRTMLYNIQASTNKMLAQDNQNKALEKALNAQSHNIEKSIIKSLKKAKFVNNTSANVDLGHAFKVNKYKGK